MCCGIDLWVMVCRYCKAKCVVVLICVDCRVMSVMVCRYCKAVCAVRMVCVGTVQYYVFVMRMVGIAEQCVCYDNGLLGLPLML